MLLKGKKKKKRLSFTSPFLISSFFFFSISVQHEVLSDEDMSVQQLEALVEKYKDAPEVAEIFMELQVLPNRLSYFHTFPSLFFLFPSCSIA